MKPYLTLLGPCFGHIRAMFWLFLQCLHFYMTISQIFTKESFMPCSRKVFNVQLLLSYWGHIWDISWPCFGYFYNIFSSRCLKWLKFSLESHACHIEEYSLMLTYLDHCQIIGTILGQCLGHIRAMFCLFLQYLCF